MNMQEYPDAELLAMNLANVLAGALNSALLRHDAVSFVVPGGSSPAPVFDALCDAHIDWSRVTVLLSDERWVPEDDPRSNAALVRKHLLVGRAAAAEFLPFYMPDTAPDAALPELTERIAPHLPISVALLGMGADMHTASLFPRGDALSQALAEDAPDLVVMRAEGLSEPRISLSARALREAMQLHLVITGEAKRAALDRALTLPPEEAPVAALLAEAVVHWAAS